MYARTPDIASNKNISSRNAAYWNDERNLFKLKSEGHKKKILPVI